jgi:hypothetical protein
MTAQTGTATQALPTPQPAEISKTYEEGIVAGLIGAAVIALWFLVLDALHGRPLYTPTVLGTALFGSGRGLGESSSLEMALMFTFVHVLVFAMLGGIAARLLALAERDPNYGFGILLLFVFFEFGFLIVAMFFAEDVLASVAWPSILVGNLFAAAAMAAYFRRHHPNLLIRP